MTANLVTAVSGFGTTPTGGYFGCAPGETPAIMRDATEGMVSLILTPPRYSVVPPTVNAERFIAGVRDEANQLGWAILVTPGLLRTPLLSFVAGDMRYDYDVSAFACFDHIHALMFFDATHLSVIINGVFVGAVMGDYAPELTAEFSIGNTTEDLTAHAGDTAVAALAFGPLPSIVTTQDTDTYLFSQWREVERAGDILDLLDLHTNVWSCRRGLANVVDGGGEVWTDWKGDVGLQRLGAQLGMSVAARPAEWGKSIQPGE
jgi:hypothetical protein